MWLKTFQMVFRCVECIVLYERVYRLFVVLSPVHNYLAGRQQLPSFQRDTCVRAMWMHKSHKYKGISFSIYSTSIYAHTKRTYFTKLYAHGTNKLEKLILFIKPGVVQPLWPEITACARVQRRTEGKVFYIDTCTLLYAVLLMRRAGYK